LNKGYRASHRPWVLFLLLLVGALAGSALNDTLAKLLPLLSSTGNIGLKPVTLDLHFMQLTVGLLVNLGPLTVVGLIIGYLVYRRV